MSLDHAGRLARYRSLLEIRGVEQRAHDLFLQNLVKGTSHLALGQEAVATGFAAAMRPDDYTFCTYRGHHHTLARGAPMLGVLGELMGRTCGLMGGKGGSMHLTSVRHGVMGSYAIVGAHLPIAAGAAWSAQYRESGQVTRYRARLLDRGFSERALLDLEAAVQRAVDDATAAATASPPPPLDVVERDLWADGGSAWRS